MNHNNQEIITITSKWYTDYTLNMLLSLQEISLSNIVNVYCLDNESYEQINEKGFNGIKIDTEYKITTSPTQFGTYEFNTFMYYKMKVMRDALKQNKKILYTDGDVVFKKNKFLEYMDNSINCDLLAIKDFNVENPQKISICAGFMYLKSNLRIRKIINPKIISKNNFKIQDQEIINSKKKWFNYEYLPQEDYCNGSFYMKNSKELNPTVIHFNYIVGDNKKDIMKKYNSWYL